MKEVYETQELRYTDTGVKNKNIIVISINVSNPGRRIVHI